MDHESRDLDGVIDEIAQGMTRPEYPRDLRPAIARRLAAPRRSWPPPWMSVWRVAAAGAAVAASLLVATMVRPGEGPRPAPVAEASSPRPAVAPAPALPADASLPAPSIIAARAVRQSAPRVPRRQTIVATPPGMVEIPPLAVVPLKTDDDSLGAEAPSQVVVIAPIEVEPVRIGQIELVE